MSPRTLVLVVLVGTAVGLGYAEYPENGFLPPAAIAAEQGKILYYRNPMGLPDTSPTPKKDSMGMDYIPVYESEETGGDQEGRGAKEHLGPIAEAQLKSPRIARRRLPSSPASVKTAPSEPSPR